MPKRFLMSLDLGGSGGRALLYHLETGKLQVSSCAWTFATDPTTGGLGYNLGGEEKWQALCAAGREVLAKAGAGPNDVVGISVTGMRHGTVLIDPAGKLLLAAPNKDARAFAEGMELAETRGDELYHRTGHAPNPVMMAARLLWVRGNHPVMLQAASAVLTISDWMAYQLCGVAACEPTQAGETCLFDLEKGGWAMDIIQSLELPTALFPRIVPTGTCLGGLTATAAEMLGLVPGIPVAAGGADTQLGLLSLGITQANEVGMVAGSTTPVMVTTPRPVIDPNTRTWSGMHAVPGVYVVESNAGAMGTSLEWAAGILYSDSPAPVTALVGDAAKAPPGAGGIFSTLGVQLFNASALSLPVEGLTFSTMTVPTGPTGRASIARSILEGMAFCARANTEQALAVAQVKPAQIYIGAGMTRSSLWNQMVADTFQLPTITGACQNASGIGAILCAAVAAGLYPDLISAAGALVKNQQSLAPSPNAQTYAELYRTWCGHYQQRTPADEIAQGVIMQAMQASMGAGAATSTSFRPRIYVSANAGEDAIRMLRELGDVTYASYAEAGTVLEGEELAQTLQGYQVLVTEVDLVNAEALQKAHDLRVVVACRGNPVNVDIPACTAAGVPVMNTPGRNADAVADLTISFLLMLSRKLDKAAQFLKEPGTEAGDMGRMGAAYFNFKGNELWHKTVGLVGCGAIGRKVTRRLLPFEARVLIYDPYLSAEEVALVGATKVSLEEMLQQSDIVSLHAPVTEETSGLMNANAFAQMKPGAFLVNTARAALVDYDALVEALRSGKLGGAALDVFPVEPPGSDDPLLSFENVIATPHIGGNTSEVGIHQGAIIVDELQRMLRGEKPRFVLNPETLDTFQWTGERRLNQAALAELSKGPGPGVSDLDLKARQQQVQEATTKPAEEPAGKQKTGGLLGGLKNLISGKGKETAAPAEAVPPAAPIPAAAPSTPAQPAAAPSFDKFNQIVERYLALLAANPEIQAFAKGKNVTFQFTIKDAGTSFYMSFTDGKATAGTGDAPVKPDVTIKSNAETLDGMFSGRLDGTAAFKSGKLSVSGNMLKAVVMQKLNFTRQYNQARAEIGDPGLTSAAQAQLAAAPAKAAAAPGAGGGAAAPVTALALIHKIGDIRDTLLEINNELYQKGWITSTGGNISVRAENNAEEVWITPSAIFKGDLRADYMVKIDLDGNIIGGADFNASSERKVHCAVYRARPEIKAVIHTHAIYSTLMALTGLKWLPISADAAFFGEIPVVPFIMPGSPELGDEVAKAMGAKGIAAIMQNHGLVVAGSDLRRAADTTEAIEITAEKLIVCHKLGIVPATLPEDVVAILGEMGSMIA